MFSASDHNRFIDVICQYTTNGTIIPLRIRVKDEDGSYQTFTIKAYKELSSPNSYQSPYGTAVHGHIWTFECKIQVLDVTRRLTLFFNSYDNLWKIIRIQ